MRRRECSAIVSTRNDQTITSRGWLAGAKGRSRGSRVALTRGAGNWRLSAWKPSPQGRVPCARKPKIRSQFQQSRWRSISRRRKARSPRGNCKREDELVGWCLYYGGSRVSKAIKFCMMNTYALSNDRGQNWLVSHVGCFAGRKNSQNVNLVLSGGKCRTVVPTIAQILSKARHTNIFLLQCRTCQKTGARNCADRLEKNNSVD
jgi:hypothetical protein